ncbi:GNAT family N-acetyltransferase [Nocardia crassostreae]|uniref:GNAT family N-acetyltransferase n=1 Tax=Nocardia crassostreae TaxID=53428 RepID=UPI00082EFD0A|nr:GNAT family N-acetyltransferase [Nocardia crassostreae]
MSELLVRRAEAKEVDAVAEVFAAASMDEVVSAWVMEDHAEIAEAFRVKYARELIENAIRDDEVWLAGADEDIWAVSLWQTVTSLDRVHREAVEARELSENSGLQPFRRMAAVTAAVAANHPPVFPHRYLHVIVTLPQHRGKGAGAAIVNQRAKAASEAGVPAYLEASIERSARLYERCGFVRDGDPILLPENGPTLRPMWFRG